MFIAADRFGCLPPRASCSCRRNLYLWRSVLATGLWLMLVMASGLFLESSLAASPTVAITSPTASATLTDAVTVTVSASETGSTIVAVGLQIDGITFGTATNTSPYTFSLNTATFANGPHFLTATAWDAANNAGNSSPVSVTFSNSTPGNPALFGVMSGTFPLPLVSVHEALLPGGRIFMSDGETLAELMPMSGITRPMLSTQYQRLRIFSVTGWTKCRTVGSWLQEGISGPTRAYPLRISLIRAPKRGQCCQICLMRVGTPQRTFSRTETSLLLPAKQIVPATMSLFRKSTIHRRIPGVSSAVRRFSSRTTRAFLSCRMDGFWLREPQKIPSSARYWISIR